MRIGNFKLEKSGGRTRASAQVIWEDCGRVNREIYFETIDEFADGFFCNPDALAVGSILPAMFFGEKRLLLSEGICPDLKEGLITNMNWYSYWYGQKYKPLLIQAPISARHHDSKTMKGVGLFLSGGVDSLYSLRMNRSNFPLDHPASIRDCFLVHGFDIYHDEAVEKKLDTFDRAVLSLKAVAEDAKVNLIPVYTNIRHLYSSVDFWMHWYFAAALSSVAHTFSGRLNKVILASDGCPKDLKPWGSHPVIDLNYSSADLLVWHDQLRDRFEKVAVVADWDIALHNMRVCTANREGFLNCCRCEKCIRTMIALFVIGKLKFSGAFPVKDITQQLLSSVRVDSNNRYILRYYSPLINKLGKMGRSDLAIILKNEFGLKGDVRRIDSMYLGGILVKLWGVLVRIFKKAGC